MTLASKDKLTPSDTVAAYRLVSRIATSQNCEVWESQHTRSRRRFAIKVLAPASRGDRQQIGYLRHEYAIGQQFEHDAIIRTEDFGVDDGLAFLIMEYFPAPSMKTWIRQAGEHAGLIPQVIQKAAAGLGHMHNRGWIHRDVKPDNFLVGDEGNVKLIDFTLARRMRGWFGRWFEGSAKAQGTLSYMSPEQIRNTAQDQRSDLYSFGCVVYELVCGKPPFTGETPNDLLQKHLNSPVPAMKSASSALTDSFVSIIKELLAKDPQNRPQSMDEVIRKLKAVKVFRP